MSIHADPHRDRKIPLHHLRTGYTDIDASTRKNAAPLVHPESPPDVIELADEVFSTSGMAKYVANITDEDEKRRGVIIGTEIGLVRQLQEQYPDTGIWPLSEIAICGTMKLTTLPKVCWSIETGNYEVKLPEDIIEKARASLERMLEIV